MKWDIEKLIDAALSGDAFLYVEMYDQLKSAKEERHLQDLKTLIELSWEVCQEEVGLSTHLSSLVYDLYYNQGLKESTLIDILGQETFDIIFDNI